MSPADSRPARSVSPRKPSAIHQKGLKSRGTSTWSTTTLNIQTRVVSMAGESRVKRRVSQTNRRYGRVYGQKRLKISPTATLGAASTSGRPTAGEGDGRRKG